jgi:hypothetical protein
LAKGRREYMSLSSFNESLTIAGAVTAVDLSRLSFSAKARSGDVFEVFVGPRTYYQVLTNLDILGRDRVEDPPGVMRNDDVAFNLQKYVVVERPIFVSGIYQQNGDQQLYEAITVYLLHSDPRRYLFEETHWWLVQTTQMARNVPSCLG